MHPSENLPDFRCYTVLARLIKFKRIAYRLQLLKHDLRTCSEKLKYKVTMLTRKSMNSRFAMDPKSVYRQMRGESFTVKSTPTQQSLESYWSTQWGQTAKIYANAQWLPDIRSTYCSDVMQSSYEVTEATLKQVLSNTGKQQITRTGRPSRLLVQEPSIPYSIPSHSLQLMFGWQEQGTGLVVRGKD